MITVFQRWTRELCQKDSDGDGRTNGEELGDPSCTWVPGATPEITTGITHPGTSFILRKAVWGGGAGRGRGKRREGGGDGYIVLTLFLFDKYL